MPYYTMNHWSSLRSFACFPICTRHAALSKCAFLSEKLWHDYFAFSTVKWWRICVYFKYLTGKWKTPVQQLFNCSPTSMPYVNWSLFAARNYFTSIKVNLFLYHKRRHHDQKRFVYKEQTKTRPHETSCRDYIKNVPWNKGNVLVAVKCEVS